MDKTHDQYASIYYSTLIASIGGLMVGYSTVIISGALLVLDNTFGLIVEQQEIVVSAAILFSILGCMLGGILCNLIGRKSTIMTAACIFFIASLFSLVAEQYTMIVVSRSIMGLAGGMASMSVPLYVSEIVPYNIRGSSVCIVTLLFYLGVMLAYLIDNWFAGTGWRLTLGSPLIPTIFLFLGMCYMPETPQWLLGNNKTEKAVSALGKLRRFVDIEWEIHCIKESSQFNVKRQSKLWGKGHLRAITIGCGIAFFMEITGAHAIFYYIPTVLKTTGLWSKSAALTTAVLLGCISFLAALAAILVIDRIGRRKLLIYGTLLMIISLSSLGVVFYFTQDCDCYHGLTVLLLFLFATGYVMGLGSVGWLLISEIFPLKYRSILMALSITIKWGVNFVVSRYFLSQLDYFGGTQTFWFYALVSVVCLLFVYFFVPETGGKSLEAIEEYWLKDEPHGIQID